MIAEFQRNWEEQHKIKTSDQLQSVIDKRNTRNEKNARRNTRGTRLPTWTREGQMETTTMGQEARVIGQSRTPNGDRITVFTSQQDQ
jgi:hypothetical protein